jgi:hypothetical protein
MKPVFATAGALLLLAGCIGPNPSLGVVEVSALPDKGAGAQRSVEVATSIPAGATPLGAISATSCRNKLWDSEPSEEDALAQLKVKAASMGATGVSSLRYDASGTSLVSNCWSSITVNATAYR